MSKSYVEETRNIITSSKLKDFMMCEYLYKIKYIDEVDLDKWENRTFVVWTAFHDLMEHWQEFFLEKYYIDEWLVKEKLIDYLVENIDQVDLSRFYDCVYERIYKEIEKLKTPSVIEQRKELLRDYKNQAPVVLSKYLDLLEIRSEFMRISWNETKIELTPAEWRDLIWMYSKALEQPAWDLWWDYTKESRFALNFWTLQLWAKPDRVLFYQWEFLQGDVIPNEARISREELDAMLKWKNKEERKMFVKENKIRGIIRDFKTTWSMERLLKQLSNSDNEWDRFGYMVSMGFYYGIIYGLYQVQCDVFLDIIETREPYISVVKWLPSWMLEGRLKQINQALVRLEEAIKSGNFLLPTRDEIISNNKLTPYYEYFPNHKQEEPSFMDLDL